MKKPVYRNNPHCWNDLLELYLYVRIDLQGKCLADVAKAAGCSASALNNWRSGKTRAPRVSTLMNVADVLGYRIEWHKL